MKYLIRNVSDFNECQYNGIPKYIHIIWKGKEKPKYLQDQINSWHKHLDETWNLLIWDDYRLNELKSVPDKYGKKIFEIAESMPEIASYVDIIRLYILYVFGGYYFDADFQIFRDIEPITHIDSDLIISNSTSAYYPYVDNAFLGCTEKNMFLRYCLDKLIEKYDAGDMEKDWIIRRTGPVYIGFCMINYENFAKTIAMIPGKYLYCNEKGDSIVHRNESGEIVLLPVEETFNGRFGRHMFLGNGEYDEQEEDVELYLPKTEVKYTKDYNDMFIVGKSHDIGDYTYGHPHVTFYEGEIGKLKTGKFCSISKDVTFFVNGYHNINCVTNYPFSVMVESGTKDFEGFEYNKKNIPRKKDIEIGNDVYIGDGAKIMGGVKIGDGAVIAAYSIVCNDVEPYEVVGGNPAKHIKYLFTEEQRKALLDIAWWNWDIEKIKENCKYLTSEDVDLFIEKFKNNG